MLDRNSKMKKILEKDLSLKQMHELYYEDNATENTLLVKGKYYRDVLHIYFEFCFPQAKKYVHKFCFSFDNMAKDEGSTKQTECGDYHR